MGYVLQGAIEIQFENEVRIYSSGDGISIPHGQEHIHMARVLSDTVTVIFVEDV
jgi:quercetin dioxygenase-like cupin family protein